VLDKENIGLKASDNFKGIDGEISALLMESLSKWVDL
jgi:hypothetical protein